MEARVTAACPVFCGGQVAELDRFGLPPGSAQLGFQPLQSQLR